MGKSSSSQSKASEPAFTIQTLQNGGHPRVEEFTRKRGLYGNNQSHRCLSDSAKRNFFIILNYQKDFSAPTLSGTRISGVFDKFQHPITSNSGGKVAKALQEMPTVARTNKYCSSRVVQIPGDISSLLQASSQPKIATLASQSTYEAELSLNPLARAEILWWRNHLHASNDRALFQLSPSRSYN